MRALRMLLAALLGVAALAGAAPVAAAPGVAAVDEVDRVVVVGAPGLSWTDIGPESTPWLDVVAREGAVASLTVRAVRSRSCAVDGWLTLSAGRRAGDVPLPCRTPPDVGADGAVPRWDDYLAAAGADSYDAVPGTLGQALEDAGVCVEAVGPGAAIAAAGRSGRVSSYSPDLPETFSCPVVLVDGGTLPEGGAARAAALSALDATVEGLVRRAAPGTRLVVAGVGDGDSAIRPRAVLVSGAGVGVGLLTSPSTQQPGLVQLQDLTATLLEWSGAGGSGATGRAVTVREETGDAADRIADRQGFEVRAGTLRSVSPQVTGWLAAAFGLWCAVSALLLWRRRPLPGPVCVAGVAIAGVPTATFLANLVPWWSAGAPAVVFVMVLSAFLAALTALAVAAGRRMRLGALLVVSVATLLVLAGDVLTGSGLQLASVFGQNPTVGGRFYGIGNTSYALYGVAVMAVVGVLATSRRWLRRHTLGLPVLVLLAATALEGHPSLGADFGGPPGLLLGGLVVLTAAAGIRLTATRVAVAVLAVGLLTAAVAVLDWLRPPQSRTHLGEFVQTVIDGGVGDVIGRKLAQNLTNLGSPPLLTIAVAALVLGLVAWRSGWRPSRAGSVVLRGVAVLALAGFAVNDSGLVIPAFAALVLLPLLLADAPVPDTDGGTASPERVPTPEPAGRG